MKHERAVNFADQIGLTRARSWVFLNKSGKAYVFSQDVVEYGSSWQFVPCYHIRYLKLSPTGRGTQREYSSKPLKHCIVKRILVFKR